MASIWSELRRRKVVRVAVAYAAVGWFLVEIASTVLPIFEAPHWAIQTFTFLVILGFPAALAFSWAFQLTPDGLQRDDRGDGGMPPVSTADRRLDFVVIAILAIALVYFVIKSYVPDAVEEAEPQLDAQTSDSQSARPGGAANPGDNSIAVLAFADLSPEGDQQYFSDGISEQILNDLAQVSDLRVTSRSSAFQFKGTGVDIPAVAAQLGVSSILEGSVRKSGNRIRITAQLIDAQNGFHLWSETYDRELEDVFAVQDDISEAIVQALTEQFGLSVTAVPRDIAAQNTEAHEAFLRGRHLIVQTTDAATDAAILEFQRAIELDPNYALAHAELAMAKILANIISDDTRLSEVIAEGSRHVERAMTLDPMLAEANAAAGLLAWRQSRYAESRQYFERALEINPNYVRVYVWLGNMLNYDLGEYADAFKMRSRAMQLDPLSISTIVFYLQALIEQDRDDEARAVLAKIERLYPHIYAYRMGSLESKDGHISKAILGSLEALRINPGYSRPKAGLQFHFAAVGLPAEIYSFTSRPMPDALILAGDTQAAIRVAEMWLAESPDEPIVQHDLGIALAAAGDYERARPILEAMWQQSDGLIAKRRDLFRVDSALALIAIRRAAGEEDKIGELVAAILDNVRRYREAGIAGDDRSFGPDFEEGLALYFSGRREAGLALLDRGAAQGVIIAPNSAYLQPLYDDPGFARIIARQEQRQARERKLFLEVVCSDNPYRSVWQPHENSCARS
ncbi:MAG: tetratricopeptide repeat protein [Woeseiaceae bacterium]|nr:tetratricopeptide repeat protein [Woeseiaceae bacterium]